MEEEIGFAKPRGWFARRKAAKDAVVFAAEQQWASEKAEGGRLVCITQVFRRVDSGVIAHLQLEDGNYIDSWLPPLAVKEGDVLRVAKGNIGPGRWNRHVLYVNLLYATGGLTHRDWPHKLPRHTRKKIRTHK